MSAPGVRWGRTWLLTAILVASSLGAWESYWRYRGFTPSLASDAHLWLLARERLARQENPLVLLGSSRIRCGLDLDVLAGGLGEAKPVQLAVDACTPAPVLAHLAADESFAGPVLCGFTPTVFFSTDPRALEPALARLRRFTDQPLSPADRVERRLRLACERRFASLLPRLSRESLFETWKKRSRPTRNFATVRYDRLRYADFTRADLPDVRGQIECWVASGSLLAPGDVPGFVAQVQASVRRIQARGGDVVFVRLPSSGRVREIERERVPRSHYWDRLVAGTTAGAVHFEDHPQLARFACPEGSHLDFREAPAFTRALVEVLSQSVSGPTMLRTSRWVGLGRPELP